MYFGIKIISPLPQLDQMIWKGSPWRNQTNVQMVGGPDACFRGVDMSISQQHRLE